MDYRSSKLLEKLAEKARPNIYEVVSFFFKLEQVAIEGTLQVAGGELPVRKRRKYRNNERRLVAIKEKYKVGDYTPSEVVKAYSHWVSF